MKVKSSLFIMSLFISLMLVGSSCRKEVEIHPLRPIPNDSVSASEIPSVPVTPVCDLKKSHQGDITDTISAFELEDGFSLQVKGKKHHSGEITDPNEINDQLTR
ncbi:MAG: hypothetical protein ABIO46_14950 [Chitinophagales bacterium]